MALMPVPTNDKQTAETIRANAEQAYAAARSNEDLSATALRKQLAQTYLKAKADMDALQQRSTTGVTTSRDAAYQAAFGLNDMGTTAGDRASAAVSYRDAQDRIAALKSAREADALMTRALGSGDELLARALAQTAYDQRAYDTTWGDILNRYLATRPAAQRAVEQLLAIDSTKVGAQSMFAFILATPSELAGMQPFQMSALADGS